MGMRSLRTDGSNTGLSAYGSGKSCLVLCDVVIVQNLIAVKIEGEKFFRSTNPLVVIPWCRQGGGMT